MRVLIVEDEPLAAERLGNLLTELDQHIEIVMFCDSVRQTIKWLEANPHPDLAFFDIQLGDGLSFEIFDKGEFRFPVIFTTAYDQYAVKAFKVNSIDYLLKPIDGVELEAAIIKFRGMGQSSVEDTLKLALQNASQMLSQQQYKERYLVKVGDHLKMIPTSDLSFFYSLDKATYLRTREGRNYAIDHTLEQIEAQCDPRQFYRISRKFLINLQSIRDMVAYGTSRLKIKVTGQEKGEELVVSRERVKSFKTWLDR
ncbi:MAG: response regulator transcription factor [Marinilabiliaceae bacterium]|nr:response regulator transcription factor [Marinilabiliaceae bacterium]